MSVYCLSQLFSMISWRSDGGDDIQLMQQGQHTRPRCNIRVATCTRDKRKGEGETWREGRGERGSDAVCQVSYNDGRIVAARVLPR